MNDDQNMMAEQHQIPDENPHRKEAERVEHIPEDSETLEEVIKELALITNEEAIQLNQTASWTELRNSLAIWVTGMINRSFEELIFTLYRIDINENKLKFLLSEKVGEDAAYIIADLIIERQLQKLKTRKEFRQPPPADEEDSW